MSGPGLRVAREGAVTMLRIDRERVHNALDAGVIAALDAAVREAATDGTRVVVLTGTGTRAFCAGADLDELAGLRADEAHAVLRAGQEVLRRVEESPVPVVAAVNGLALGGGLELLLACTFSVLADHAELGLPETGLGLVPGYGGTQRLARAVGRPAAAHAVVTGQRIGARRAHQLGLTPLEPVPSAELDAAVAAVADQICRNGPAAVRSALELLRLGADAPLATGLALESAHAALATGGPEAAEGVAAFRGRRRAHFASPDGSDR